MPEAASLATSLAYQAPSGTSLKPGSGTLGQAEGAREERGHLGPGGGITGAEPGPVAASLGDAQLGESLYECGMGMGGLDIREACGKHRCGVAGFEDPNGPHRHGSALYRFPRAETLVAAGADEHAALRQRLHSLRVVGAGGRVRILRRFLRGHRAHRRCCQSQHRNCGRDCELAAA